MSGMMEARELDEAVKVLDSSLRQIKWRLKFPAKRRLEIDVLALCTGMRPVVMIDYGGKMPELQERLCALLKLMQKELHIFEHLKVMVIEDMIYLIHVQGLAEHIQSSLNSRTALLLVDIAKDPPQMIIDPLGLQLKSVQKLFSSLFSLDEMENDPSPSIGGNCITCIRSSFHEISSRSSVIDLSNFLEHTEITLPTLNGWLLGYPIVYLFDKEHISEATYNLSAKPLHIFSLSVSRKGASTKRSQLEELLSFTVPYEVSMGGAKEAWAEAFLGNMQRKWERCSHVWGSLRMNVTECDAQAIVLSTSLGAKSTWSFIRSLEKTGRGCTGTRDTLKNLPRNMQIMSLLKMRISPLIGIGNPVLIKVRTRVLEGTRKVVTGRRSARLEISLNTTGTEE